MSRIPMQERIEEIRARAELRFERAFSRYLLVGIPLIALAGLGLVMVLASFQMRRQGRRLKERGILVSARLPATDVATDGYANAMLGGAGVKLIRSALEAMGRFVPAVLTSYIVNHDGKEKHLNSYLFSTERPEIDAQGRAWALIDPDRPRTYSWLVCVDGTVPLRPRLDSAANISRDVPAV